jgi:hypothetical protein
MGTYMYQCSLPINQYVQSSFLLFFFSLAYIFPSGISNPSRSILYSDRPYSNALGHTVLAEFVSAYCIPILNNYPSLEHTVSQDITCEVRYNLNQWVK